MTMLMVMTVADAATLMIGVHFGIFCVVDNRTQETITN